MTLRTVFLILLSVLSVTSASAQEKIVIPLRLNTEAPQAMGMIIASRTATGPLSYSSPTTDGRGYAPDDVLFKLEPVEGAPHTYRLFVDANGDGDLRNETPQTLSPNSSSIARVNRKWSNQKQLVLPYTIKYTREANSRGRMSEDFFWSPHYMAEGRLKVANCDALFRVRDMSSDGQFDDRDLGGGSTLAVDRNGDGVLWGKDENLMGNQIIEFCGDRFVVEALAIDGTSITLARTTLRVPKIGEQLSEFSLTTLDGQTIDSKNLRNKIHLLDFWASWCPPCVENFPLVKQIADEFKADVSVIAINVDDKESLRNAHEVIKTYGLTWPHVMQGQGEGDPLWKTFGGMEGNRLAIPLYVIVDTEGRLRYAANGGEGLSELRKAIKSLLK